MGKTLLDRVLDIADRMCAEQVDVRRLPEPLRTVAVVASAQGAIDNGGLRYFLERDWPEQPPYDLFSSAYRAIGATALADALDAAAAAFAIDHPERHCEQRLAFVESPRGERIIEALDTRGCADDGWDLLAKYAHTHRDALLVRDSSPP